MDSVNPSNDDHQEFSISLENFEPLNSIDETIVSRKRRFLDCMGTHELFSLEMWKAALTELVATACLLFTLTISIISCLDSDEADPKFLIPFTIFFIAFFLLLTTVPLSGGHMSPIFTFIATLKGFTSIVRGLFYMLAQCIGSIIAYMLIKSVMDHRMAEKYYLGGCIIDGNGKGIPDTTALVLEFCCTFVVLFVGVTVGFDKRRFKELGLVMVCVILAASMGLAVFVSIGVTGRAGYGGVGLNPARCLGPALLHGGSLWNGHWVFWVGPFLACLVYHAFSFSLPSSIIEDVKPEL